MPLTITFDKTREALAVFNAHDAKLLTLTTNDEVFAWMAENDRLARAVGRAFGEDTNYINSPDICESCVRPGTWLDNTIAKPITVTDEQLASLAAWREERMAS